ncbi:DNA repair protein RadA [Austwickia sp. TVS 96-490-7B]|uniref:DNA repair protein RadA n=1 Tax=Austwickia sp. TVS 96-490-7B TaxID=2830843 RepID=UPI001C56CF40|nr:DNA repair protein RadA [Austwickia sp. TVS 96-490-7B]
MARTTPSRAARSAPGYRCTECGWTAVKWVGRCGECQSWGTVEEVGQTTARTAPATRLDRPARPIEDVDASPAAARTTGVPEFDRVLGRGLVAGSVVLVAGEPGIGKSTLLLDVAARTARLGHTVLYVTGEESAAQVRLRAERIGALADQLYLAAETDLSAVLAQIEKITPDLLIVDSVQTIASLEVDGSAGNVSQVREVTASLISTAKTRDMATLLVGHVTKDGSIAGPRVLEHLVDVVIQFEGERGSRLRLVRAVKNRYGPTDEVGCFDLGDTGIEGLADPSGLFVSSRDLVVPGTAVTVTLEGRRPLVAEIQALLAPTSAPSPRRTTSGLDSSRIAMLLAVLERRARMPVGRCDTYVSTVGGVRVAEPAADLAAALAMASSVLDRPLPTGMIALGEVGLAGEVRPVTGVPRRLAEAARIGFTRAVVPAGSFTNAARGHRDGGLSPRPVGPVIKAPGIPDTMSVIEVADLRHAAHLVLTDTNDTTARASDAVGERPG